MVKSPQQDIVISQDLIIVRLGMKLAVKVTVLLVIEGKSYSNQAQRKQSHRDSEKEFDILARAAIPKRLIKDYLVGLFTTADTFADYEYRGNSYGLARYGVSKRCCWTPY